jgi:hypothetical protein
VLNESYAGLFARWVARIAVEDSNPEEGLQVLTRQFPAPQNLHPKDSLELRAAQASLHRRLGTLKETELNSIRKDLSTLPAGISTILKEVGLHPDFVGYP